METPQSHSMEKLKSQAREKPQIRTSQSSGDDRASLSPAAAAWEAVAGRLHIEGLQQKDRGLYR